MSVSHGCEHSHLLMMDAGHTHPFSFPYSIQVFVFPNLSTFPLFVFNPVFPPEPIILLASSSFFLDPVFCLYSFCSLAPNFPEIYYKHALELGGKSFTKVAEMKTS